MFNAVSRPVLCYAAQVWGYEQFDRVEALQRFFFKKMFRLPYNTPNYILATPIFFHNLKLHFNYIIRAISMKGNRYPKLLALDTIRKKCYWYKYLEDLCNKFNIVSKNITNIHNNSLLTTILNG